MFVAAGDIYLDLEKPSEVSPVSLGKGVLPATAWRPLHTSGCPEYFLANTEALISVQEYGKRRLCGKAAVGVLTIQALFRFTARKGPEYHMQM